MTRTAFFCPLWMNTTSKCPPHLYEKPRWLKSLKNTKGNLWRGTLDLCLLLCQISFFKSLSTDSKFICNHKSHQLLSPLHDYSSLLFLANATISINTKFNRAVVILRDGTFQKVVSYTSFCIIQNTKVSRWVCFINWASSSAHALKLSMKL